MLPLDDKTLQQAIADTGIVDITTATIRQICTLAAKLEQVAGEKFIHLELGNPGLKSEEIGIQAEIEALQKGIANKYPDIAGLPALKNAASRFIKAFLDVDIPSKCIIPTVGSMQGSYTIMTLLKQRIPGKDTMLMLYPGFPAQTHQAKMLGLKVEGFDIYHYRGRKLEAKLEEILSKGNVTGLLYSNPNNPAWTNFTDEELEIIGRMATKYDVIVIEDLAYLGMDFRKDFSEPFTPPYIPSVAKYTDNYILLISASKIFSYAGQRIAVVCISEKVYHRVYPNLVAFYEMPNFGDAYVYGVLYTASSGTAHSAQHAMAKMLEKAADGELKFIHNTQEYGRRAAIIKEMLHNNGFNTVYAKDGENEISDGFFFTAGYKDMESHKLQNELFRYGISSISLPSTGSKMNGVRICVSMISDDDSFKTLESRLKKFHDDHK